MCNIEKNTFNINEFGGLGINDRRRAFYPDDHPMLVQVKNNIFNMNNDAISSIYSVNMYGIIIRNNQFNGNGQYGVVVAAPKGTPPVLYPYNQNGLMLGNNFSNAICSVAAVHLDARTENWTIIGGNLGETVIDLNPVAGNNKITGFNVNTSGEPLGQTIKDNLEEWRGE